MTTVQTASGKDAGVTGTLNMNMTTYTFTVVVGALALYNIIELNLLVFSTFKRYGGLYFWSLIIASWGVVLHLVGFILKFFPTGTNVYLSCAIITVGWYCMVTGQSVVLYSRLHLVVSNPKIFKGVLVMIICDVFLFHFPTTVLTFLSNEPINGKKYSSDYMRMEKIQMTAFCIQEFIISFIYVKYTLRLLNPMSHKTTRAHMLHLIYINLLIIVMDLVLLAVEYASLYDKEVVLKSLIYSLKLKLEFAVLSQLVNYTKIAGRNNSQNYVQGRGGFNSAVSQDGGASYGHHSAGAGVEKFPTYKMSSFNNPSKGGILKTERVEVQLSGRSAEPSPERNDFSMMIENEFDSSLAVPKQPPPKTTIAKKAGRKISWHNHSPTSSEMRFADAA